jgi:PKD repeat protein
VVIKRIRGVVVAMVLLGAVTGQVDLVRAAPGDIGYEGPSYTGVSGSHPSQEKPESKLWYHDGTWWGSLWSNAAGSFNVHRLNPITHTWTDTGTVIESAGTYRQDTLFDGTKLYVSSHRYATSGGTATARLTRFSYNASTEQWTKDSGFPATISNDRSETLTIAKDSIGRLWATWTSNGEVWVNHTTCSSSCNDASWATPFKLNSIGAIGSAATTATDDISSIVAFDGKIGVFWSNQSANADYFAVHSDGASTTTWTRETALSGSNEADDHINIAADDSGNLFVAVKTSHDNSGMPETYLLKRTQAGSWSKAVTTMGTERLTRPIVTYDRTADELHWFAADVGGGKVYTKVSAASNPSFSSGTGTAVLFDASADDMNDVSSTKQSVDPSTGLVVLATDNVSKTYWHNEDTLGGTASITAGFSASPVSGEAPVDVQFTDTSVGSPTSWAWNFGDGGTSTARNPMHTYTTPGTYTVSLTASKPGQSDSEVKTGYISIIAPQALAATFTTDPSRGAAPLSVQFTDTSPGTPTSWFWEFGDGNTSTAQNPTHVYNAIGSYDVTLTVTNATTATATATVPSAVIVTDEVTLNPVADAFVRADRPTNNYGTETYLRVRQATSGYRSLVKFDVQDVGTQPVTATLRMFVEDGSPHAGDLYVVGNGWTEAGVTDGNAPIPSSTPDVLGSEAVLGAWHEWDVTPLITGDGEYSFMLISTSGNSGYFSSREGTNPPELVITTASTAPLAAAFAGDPTSIEAGQTVNFTDLSTGVPTSWAWDFGDGGTSTAQNPSHTYTTPGNFNVTLTVTDGATNTDTWTEFEYVNVSAALPLNASFGLDAPSGAAPHVVNFSDTSTGAPTTWSWNFGDGATSNLQNPQHTYTAPGTYTVTLTVGDGVTTDVEVLAGAVTVSANSTVTAVADAHVRSDRVTNNYGTENRLRIRFASTEYRTLVRFDVAAVPTTVTSAKVRMYVDDASPSSGDLYAVGNSWTETGVTWSNQPTVPASPVALGGPAVAGTWHEWDVTDVLNGASPGSFSFTLIGTSGNSAYFSSREGTNPPQLVIEGVSSPPPLASAFSGTPVSGSAPLSVQFTDLSTGAPTSWSWNFGDGSSVSTLQNPSHVYTAPGLYNVSLTVSKAGGTPSVLTKNAYVNVTAPPPLASAFSGTPVSGSAPLSVQFTDLSTGAPTSWSWNFGDGSSVSTLQNPSHVYTAPGLYNVSLTVSKAGGTPSVLTKNAYVNVTAPPVGPTTFTATEDAYVKTDRPDNNYGGDTWLRLRQSASVYESLLKFDVSGLSGAPSNATLRLFVTDESPSAGAVSTIDPLAWAESTVTWNSRPAPLASIAADRETPPVGQWVEWDVTSAVIGNGLVSFSLSGTSGNSAYYSSREGANPPQLVVTP